MKFSFKFFITLVITLIALEFFIRVSEIRLPTMTKDDPILGSKLKKNANYIVFNEGFSMGSINRFGYLGPGYGYDKNEDTIRIALMGDSFVEGIQFFDRHHIRYLLEEKLNFEIQDRRFEVLNFGRSGFNLNDAYCYYCNFASKFNPDLVLYFVDDNDLNSVKSSSLRPFCYLDNKIIKIDYTFSSSNKFIHRYRTRFLRGKSVLLAYVINAAEVVNQDLWSEIIFDKFEIFKKPQKTQTELKKVKFPNEIQKLLIELSKDRKSVLVLKNPIQSTYLNFLENTDASVWDPGPQLHEVSKTGIDLHYWKATNTSGHFNHRAHEIISNFLKEKVLNYCFNPNNEIGLLTPKADIFSSPVLREEVPSRSSMAKAVHRIFRSDSVNENFIRLITER